MLVLIFFNVILIYFVFCFDDHFVFACCYSVI